MTQGTRSKSYAAAQDRLAAGIWRCDPEAGLIYGSKGAPLTARTADGYPNCKPAKGGTALCHRVIWEYVHGVIPDGLEVNHINGVKTDNRIANLELVTRSANMLHACKMGLAKPPPGRPARERSCAKHDVSRWTRRKDGRGECLECKRLQMKAKRAQTLPVGPVAAR